MKKLLDTGLQSIQYTFSADNPKESKKEPKEATVPKKK